VNPDKIGVIGAGTMGSGIAQLLATCGIDVVLMDIDEATVKRGLMRVRGNLDLRVEKGKITLSEREFALARIAPTTQLADVAGCDVVIEAAAENVDLKLKLFAELDRIAKPAAILASNTSSISLGRIARATRRPGQVIGMHFFNPAAFMPLIELVRGPETSDATYEQIEALTSRLGKTPVRVLDSPGFVSNRVLMPMLNEAVYCLHEGLANAEDIDKIMKLGMAHPMGPLELADFIGLDTCLFILNVLHDGFKNEKYRPCPLWRQKIDAGHLGRKTKRGFFTYA
jgi:3-hydroxybutyryl-CoA dehydrogenase